MVSQIKRGIQDFIGAARPSIADPFLPNKINEGREDEIRECIGCNMCRAANNEAVHLRCTQNPTMGEEWRRGWHPARIAAKHQDQKVLVVGAGPAGLEAALALGQRGYDVTLAEKSNALGGRLLNEVALAGLGKLDSGAGLPRAHDFQIAECRSLSWKRHGCAGYCGFWR